MNNLESFILRQKEIDICNDKIKKYEMKYKINNLNVNDSNCNDNTSDNLSDNSSDNIKNLNDYLNEQLQLFKYEGVEKNILMDDINLLSKYL